MFNELKNEITKLNISNIELTVWPYNKEAIAFYESVGMSVKNIKYELNNGKDIDIETLKIKTTQNTK